MIRKWRERAAMVFIGACAAWGFADLLKRAERGPQARKG